MHVRMHDAGTVEINNPMFLKEEGDEDHASEPSLIFDSDKVSLLLIVFKFKHDFMFCFMILNIF